MQGRITYNWLIGARTDSLFFFLPIAFGFATILALTQTEISSSACLTFLALQGLGLGPFHMGMTWAHFKDPKTSDHLVGTAEQKKWATGLVLLVFAFCIAGVFYYPMVVTAVFLTATIHHIVRQNAGILTLYHNKNECVPPKQVEEKTLNLSAWLCALIFLARACTEQTQQYLLYTAVLVVFTLFALSVKGYLEVIASQQKEGKAINLPALFFWILAILFFFPFAFMTSDYNQFLVAPLVMHWFQYVIINWVLISRRNNSKQTESIGLWNFVLIAALFMIALVGTGALIINGTNSPSLALSIFTGTLFALTLIHYVQDAFLWRLRDPVLKNMIIPYIKVRESSI